MTVESLAPFVFAFFLLALAPGPGLAAIVSRTLGSGLKAGSAVVAGLVVGDLLFMGIAIVGLSAIAAALGPLFQFVKYAGAAYLVWLGYQTLISAAKPVAAAARAPAAPWRDVGLGLLVTLGNPKPILFYGAIFPALFDMTAIGVGELAILGAVVIVISYLVYGGYMIAANRARQLVASTRAVKRLNQATGTLLIGTGIVAATR